VTDDGAETDLDLGLRTFLEFPTSQQIMLLQEEFISVIEKRKRVGEKNRSSGTSLPMNIKDRQQLLGNYDIVITEIGGTVGDIESLPYIESVRQMVWDLGNNAICDSFL
jgi:CTP synthase